VVISTSNSFEYENHSYISVLQKLISKRHSFSGTMNYRIYFHWSILFEVERNMAEPLAGVYDGHRRAGAAPHFAVFMI